MAFRLSVTRLTANPLFATSSYAAITPASFRGKQTISRGIKQMLDEANKTVDTLTTEQAIELHAKNDPNVVFVDLRDPRELEREGKMPGAFHCPRGMLEFWIDPESPYGKPIFQEDKRFVFFCAGGLRSALSAKVAQEMGLKPVSHVQGGFGGWKKKNGPVEEFKKKEK